jgi:hypothetical protein
MKYLNLEGSEKRIPVVQGQNVTVDVQGQKLIAEVEDAYAVASDQSISLGDLGGELSEGTYLLVKVSANLQLEIDL